MVSLMPFQSLHVEAYIKRVEAEDKKQRFCQWNILSRVCGVRSHSDSWTLFSSRNAVKYSYHTTLLALPVEDYCYFFQKLRDQNFARVLWRLPLSLFGSTKEQSQQGDQTVVASQSWTLRGRLESTGRYSSLYFLPFLKAEMQPPTGGKPLQVATICELIRAKNWFLTKAIKNQFTIGPEKINMDQKNSGTTSCLSTRSCTAEAAEFSTQMRRRTPFSYHAHQTILY
jgi:hypothetical protein